jgi:hypothetical protein
MVHTVNKSKKRNHLWVAAVVLVLGAVVYTFATANSADDDAQQQDFPKVDVVTIHPEEVRVWKSFSGRF